MKGYVCAILLLMCGVAHCWTSYDRTGCIIQSQFLMLGEIREYECGRMECQEDGEIIHQICPEVMCPPGKAIISLSENSGKPFPRCCNTLVCSKL